MEPKRSENILVVLAAIPLKSELRLEKKSLPAFRPDVATMDVLLDVDSRRLSGFEKESP